MNWTFAMIPLNSIKLFGSGYMVRMSTAVDFQHFIARIQHSHLMEPIPVMQEGDTYILLDDKDVRQFYKAVGFETVLARVYPPMSTEEQVELIRHPYIPQYSPAKSIEQDEKQERLVMSAQSAHFARMVPAWQQQ